MAEVNTNGAAAPATAAAGNVKYKVEVTCWWNDMLYREGDIVELPANVKPFVAEYFTKM